MLDYCKQDVLLLMKGAEKFRDIIRAETDMNIFLIAPTISSGCNKIYRGSFMKEDTIANISQHGLDPKKKQSKEAMLWLAYMEHREGVKIQREVRISVYSL